MVVLELFHQWLVDALIHWRKNTLVGNCAIKNLLDRCTKKDC